MHRSEASPKIGSGQEEFHVGFSDLSKVVHYRLLIREDSDGHSHASDYFYEISSS